MRKLNPKSSHINSFKYSILISLHYYDIPNNLQRISNLHPYTHRYNFIHITPAQFEVNNPDISLNIFNENQEQIYISNNNTFYQANIVQINNRYAAIKPHKNKFVQLNKILKSFSHMELKEYILRKIIHEVF